MHAPIVSVKTKALNELMFDRRLNMSGLAKLIRVDPSTISKLMADPSRDGSVIVAKLLTAVDGEFRDFSEVKASDASVDVDRAEDSGDSFGDSVGYSSTAAGRLFRKTTRAEDGDCLVFEGAPTADGYGAFYAGPITGTTSAHRVAYVLTSGEPIPKGFVVCHSCDVRRCVKHAHLFLGTPADNVRDMVAKGRQSRGEKHGSSKLNEDDVRIIRSLYPAVNQRVLAGDFGVSSSTISAVVNGTTWRHVEAGPMNPGFSGAGQDHAVRPGVPDEHPRLPPAGGSQR